MKKNFLAIIAAVIFFAALPAVTFAADFKTVNNYLLGQTETATDDTYVGAQTVDARGIVKGDFIAAGNDILISGSVNNTVMAVGNTVRISGTVGRNVRVSGASIIIDGNVGHDVLVGGGIVTVFEQASIGGDFITAAGTVTFDGSVKGNVRIYGQKVTLNGNVDGNVTIVGSSVTIGKDAVIKGTLAYTAPKQATVETGAQIIGSTTFTKNDFENKNRGMFEIRGFIGMLMTLTLALVLVLMFKKFSGTVIEGATKYFWKDLGMGFLTGILAFIASVVFMITIIGMPISALIGLIGAIGMILAGALADVLIGSWIISLTARKKVVADWRAALVGVLFVWLLCFVPFFGWLVRLGVIVGVFGTIARIAYQKFWLSR